MGGSQRAARSIGRPAAAPRTARAAPAEYPKMPAGPPTAADDRREVVDLPARHVWLGVATVAPPATVVADDGEVLR